MRRIGTFGTGPRDRGGVAGLVRGVLPRQALIAVLATGGIWLLAERLGEVDVTAISTSLGQTRWSQWAGALFLTLASFRAVGRYDALVQAEMGLPVQARAARRAGAAAIAAAQVLGFGLVSGALVRWRLLPGTGLASASRITLAVALSFLAAWAVLLVLALALVPAAGLPAGLATTARAALVGLALAFWVLRRRLMPALPFAARLLVLAAADTLAAAAALWLLLPDTVAVSLAAFYPVYLLALGAALLTGLPGGVGAFEAVILAALPAVGDAATGTQTGALLGAILAFRLVYYALPAIWAGVVMWRGPRGARQAGPAAGRHARRLLARSHRAEAGLARQDGYEVLGGRDGRSGWVVARAGATLAALGDPLGDAREARMRPALLSTLSRRARSAGLAPCLYKVGPRTALIARRAGWAVLPVAEDLWLDPGRWHEGGHGQARLRRKLRRAEAAGLAIMRHGPGAPLPLDGMATVAADWAGRHGGERGLSMGRFDPGLLARQQVFTASAGGRIVAFATFHASHGEWTLDLMRQAADCPDGAMQALVASAIGAARAAGLPRLSLAAVPVAPAGRGAVPALLRRLARGSAGLRQFKTAFGPRHRTLYLAAPGRLALLRAAVELAWAIHHPRPLHFGPPQFRPPHFRPPHFRPPHFRPLSGARAIRRDGGQDEIESRPPSWHIGRQDAPHPAPAAAAVAERHSDERPPFPPA
ncbi:phosphatidylglycerol lysyltransferase domain-containing protein [Albidovulum sediminis]|uniref:Phosphatidylglycerol lysyltransferase domain-containing protein n=1 Tax=Albidovulum sediminis TaxID=3066345 RepID=A0ABT2NJG0_9RHOB|nr:phosphatidylglycerol lysyltransferase domain-containing protein [Defluviimonas sediminis]MCT8329057.1 phosphatidylglycerol lysyltransferase domain-containing protein [Defluviimonas sediminis]